MTAKAQPADFLIRAVKRQAMNDGPRTMGRRRPSEDRDNARQAVARPLSAIVYPLCPPPLASRRNRIAPAPPANENPPCRGNGERGIGLSSTRLLLHAGLQARRALAQARLDAVIRTRPLQFAPLLLADFHLYTAFQDAGRRLREAGGLFSGVAAPTQPSGGTTWKWGTAGAAGGCLVVNPHARLQSPRNEYIVNEGASNVKKKMRQRCEPRKISLGPGPARPDPPFMRIIRKAASSTSQS